MWGDCRFRNAGTLAGRKNPRPRRQRRQNAGVSTAMKLRISSRPSSMASVHTHT